MSLSLGERPRVLVYVILASVLARHVHAQLPEPKKIEEEPETTPGPTVNEPEKSAKPENGADKELFKKLFVKRRKEHLEAIRTLQKMDSYERVYKMIMVLGETVVDVIETSKALLESAGYSPDHGSFPKDDTVRDALSNVLQNTALFGDIILRMPDIAHRILKNQQRWRETMRWSLNFAGRASYLLDEGTVGVIELVGQELNVTQRDAGYFNPYWSKPMASEIAADAVKKKRPAKRDKRKKGPRIVKMDL